MSVVHQRWEHAIDLPFFHVDASVDPAVVTVLLTVDDVADGDPFPLLAKAQRSVGNEGVDGVLTRLEGSLYMAFYQQKDLVSAFRILSLPI